MVNEGQCYLKCLVDIFCKSSVKDLEELALYSDEMRRFMFIALKKVEILA